MMSFILIKKIFCLNVCFHSVLPIGVDWSGFIIADYRDALCYIPAH